MASCWAASGGRPCSMPASMRASRNSNTYAGPLPERPVTASRVLSSGAIHVSPTALNSVSAASRSAGLAAALPQKAVAPWETRAGVLGIARMMRVPAGSAAARVSNVIPAAMLIQSTDSAPDPVGSADSTSVTRAGLTARTTVLLRSTRASLFSKTGAPVVLAKASRCSDAGSDPASRWGSTPAPTSPVASACAMAPQPMNPMQSRSWPPVILHPPWARKSPFPRGPV